MRYRAVILGVLMFISPLVWAGDIEVIIGGKSYDSIHDYRAAKKGAADAKLAPLEKIDPQTEQAINKLKSVSSEQSVSRVTADFDQNWNNPIPKFNIEENELEQRLKAVAADRKEPILVVAENGKLRVMLLDENKESLDFVLKQNQSEF